MKVLDVNEFYAERGGGVKTYVNEKLRAATALGHELCVVAPGPRDAEEARYGGRVIWVKGPPMPLDPRYYVMLREGAIHRIIDRERPDLIEGSSSWVAGWIAARYPGPVAKALVYHQDPVLVYPHTLLDRWVAPETIDRALLPFWHYVRSLAGHFDATVVAGHWLSRRLTKLGVPRVCAVPFGIDRGLFSPSQRDPALRQELLRRCGLSERARLLVSVSRLHPEKRLPTLFEAVGRLRRELDVGLVVFGDGPFKSVVERAARQVPGVHLAGFERDRAFLARVLASADAMLHGSAAETYGFVIAEAMCSGTPIVAPDHGGAFELVAPEFSEVYRASDSEACAAAIRRLLARDRVALSQAAYAAARARLRDPSEHFSALFELYARLVQQRRE